MPRIFEKIYTAATSGMEKEGGLKKAIFNWAIEVGKRMREAERAGREPGFLLRRQYEFADERVLSKIRGLFGGKIRLAVSGAAPINPEILSFFDAAGVLVLEGWGMTETSTAATISTAEDFKVGTIGKPFPGCEVRIAEDGEILVKGPNVFQGYYKNEEATRETIVDGWLHTGDIGEIDEDGFITITGRKKDIIITAGGKNITPANLENEIKQHPLVSQCVVVGDRRPYLVALVTLDPEDAAAYAKEHGLPEDPEQLADERPGAQGDRRPRRGDQREIRPRRAGQEDRDPAPRPLPGERRADADAEGQAGGGHLQARAGDRGSLRRLRWLGGCGVGCTSALSRAGDIMISSHDPSRKPSPRPSIPVSRIDGFYWSRICSPAKEGLRMANSGGSHAFLTNGRSRCLTLCAVLHRSAESYLRPCSS